MTEELCASETSLCGQRRCHSASEQIQALAALMADGFLGEPSTVL
jgi:hypothetical protein